MTAELFIPPDFKRNIGFPACVPSGLSACCLQRRQHQNGQNARLVHRQNVYVPIGSTADPTVINRRYSKPLVATRPFCYLICNRQSGSDQ
jgi:hypothetical protein